MAAKGFGAKSIELLGSGNATINSGNDIVLNPNSKVSVAGTFHTIGQILGYNGTAGSADQILVSNSSGQANWSSITDTNNPVPSSFLQLSDTPTRTNDLYTSNDAGKIVVVNNSNTALEFRAHNFLNLDDTPNSYTANTLVAIKSNISGTQKIEFIEKDTFVSTGNDINADGTVTFNYWKRFQIYHGNQITNFDAESKGDTFTILEGNGIGFSTDNQINNASLRIDLTDTVTITKLVVSGPLVEKFTRISGTTSASLDLRDGNVFQLVLGSSTTTVSFTNCPASSGEAYSFTLIVTNTFTADVGITWPTSVKWAGTGGNGNTDVPIRTEAAHKSDVWVFTTYDEGTTWLGVIASFGYDQLPTS